jgi:putative nucleotidyltransferase with HDIG domain
VRFLGSGASIQLRAVGADYRAVKVRSIVIAQALLLALAVATAVVANRPSDWQPIELFFLLLVFAVASDALTIEVRSIHIAGGFLALVLAMAVLGPLPAVTIGLVTTGIDAVRHRRPLPNTLANLAAFAVCPVVGALFLRAFAPEQESAIFALAVLIVFMVTVVLNFLMVASCLQVLSGIRLRDTIRTVLLPVLPSEFAIALLTASVAYSFATIGVGAVGLLAVVLFIFQYLIRTVITVQERGEELTKRTQQLASLQVGLLSTVLQTLSMRDAMTARHSAAVARYAREVAAMMGLDERQQDLIHTAALLHDIGKFILPDSVLFANRKLTDEEWELIKLHPEQGAKLVERIEGYGPVAEIVLHHHEKFAGGGYPAGIAGEEIPLGARIISAADTYDVMTARDSYRRPVSSEAALAELRRVAGTQLDPQVVEVFERMILERRVAFSHTDEADFESELAFEKRVADYARPRALAA